jgi:nucleoside-diphosphate-sugar epimerase
MARPGVLVIGATGFIGSWVTKLLCATGFHDVRAGSTSAQRVSRLSGIPVSVVHCDILNRESLSTAMRGMPVVINCVRDRSATGVTVEGTRLLLSAAATSGVSRIIQMSSIAVYGKTSGTVTEDTRPVPPMNRYAIEKREAEELCRAAAGPDLTIAVVRPSLVYGPFGEEWSGRFIRGIVSGKLGQLGQAGEGEANLIYAGDLGQFAAHLVTAELPHYSVFNANGSEIPTFNEYFDRLSLALGCGPLPPGRNSLIRSTVRHVRRAGRFALRGRGAEIARLAGTDKFLAAALRRAEKALRYDLRDGPPDQHVQQVVYSIERARQIGFVPQTSLQAGIEASVLWARSDGLTG